MHTLFLLSNNYHATKEAKAKEVPVSYSIRCPNLYWNVFGVHIN